MTERLDKFLVSQGIGSRKEVTRLVRRGSVMVDGKPTSTADCKIDPENSKVTVEGKEIVYRRFLYIMMNKPGDAGVLLPGPPPPLRDGTGPKKPDGFGSAAAAAQPPRTFSGRKAGQGYHWTADPHR